jgi:hypothetical protein
MMCWVFVGKKSRLDQIRVKHPLKVIEQHPLFVISEYQISGQYFPVQTGTEKTAVAQES